MLNVLNALSESYTSNKPLFIIEALFNEKFSQQEWQEFTKRFDCKYLNEFECLNKEEIFDIIYDATSHYGFDQKTICSFGNLSLALMQMNYRTEEISNYIIENNIKFSEIIRFEKKGNLAHQMYFYPISELKYSDIYEHFNYAFENWRNEHSIFEGSSLVKLCDYFGINVETEDESPANWEVAKNEFVGFRAKYGNDELNNFARLFSKPIDQWYNNWYNNI